MSKGEPQTVGTRHTGICSGLCPWGTRSSLPPLLLYSLSPVTPKGTLIKFRVEGGPTQSWSHPGLGSSTVSPNGCLPCPALSLQGVIYGPITTRASEGLQDGLLLVSQEQGGGFHYHPSAGAGPEKADTATRHRGCVHCSPFLLHFQGPQSAMCQGRQPYKLVAVVLHLGVNLPRRCFPQ